MASSVSSSSPEYTAMRECYPHLINFVKETPSTITDALFAKGYISSTVRDSVRIESKSATDKARVLVDVVVDRVEFRPEVYHDFVEILEKEGICANDIIQDLKKTYKAKSDCASVSDPDSTTIMGNADSCLSPTGGDGLVDLHMDERHHKSAGGTATHPANDRQRTQVGFICPFCKKCSVDEYFSRKGCPKAVLDGTEQQNMFPYLNTEALSEVDRQELEAKLLQDTTKMVCLFASFRSKIIGSFELRAKSHELDVKKVLDYVSSLGKSSSVSPKVLAGDDEVKLNGCKTILSIFSTLLPYTSFFHFTILQLIIKEFGATNDLERLEKYVAVFDQFCKRSVFEVPYNMFRYPLREDGWKVFSLKYSTDEIPTLGNVIRVRQGIAHIFDVSVWKFQLCSVEEGCVCLRFWIPPDVACKILPVSKEKEAALTVVSVSV